MFAQQLEKDFDSEPLNNEMKTAAILALRAVRDGTLKIENVNLGPEFKAYEISSKPFAYYYSRKTDKIWQEQVKFIK